MSQPYISPYESLTAAEEMHAGLTIPCIMAHSTCLTSFASILRKFLQQQKKREDSKQEIPIWERL